ncbi:Alpha-glucosides permease MPH3 [Colletotrichum trifolii]|uniref:Alpha-glucosides permease MPH3 n=1 Tax=Colletotrichum trifolii TaxID=5466 RepID=A0A4R8QUL8_COLTR|nr:Alpha-glucosides permease MPH3 [Colletotrichum trifolii]
MAKASLCESDSRSAIAVANVERHTPPGPIKMDSVAHEDQEKAGIIQSFRNYPQAVGFSMVLSLCIVMEAYDTSLIGNFYGLAQFRRRFGVQLENGEFQLTWTWQSALQNGTQVGQMVGLLISGIVAEQYGYKKTLLGALALNAVFVLVLFFAQNIGYLLAGGILCGLPWGAFQTLTTTYAADVTPMALRPMMTTYTNMCWVVGQFIGTGGPPRAAPSPGRLGVAHPLRPPVGFSRPPIVVGVALAPESPTWLVRKGRLDEARRALRRLAGASVSDAQLDLNMAVIAHTNDMEKHNEEGTSYVDCFRGTNRRRTAIASLTWVGQVTCGMWFGSNLTYFLQQAGLDSKGSFDFALGTSAMAILGTAISWLLLPHVGRRTLYVGGLAIMLAVLVAVGGLGVPNPTPSLGLASGVLLMVFVFIYDVSVGPVTYCLVAEIPSTRLRIKTVALARNAFLLVSVGANFLGPPVLNPSAWNLRGKGGFVAAGFCFCELVWAFFCLPEPKGRSPAELEVLFEQSVSARKFAETKPHVFTRVVREKKDGLVVNMAEEA